MSARAVPGASADLSVVAVVVALAATLALLLLVVAVVVFAVVVFAVIVGAGAAGLIALFITLEMVVAVVGGRGRRHRC